MVIFLNGILNILKPPGITSHDVVSIVRKKLNIRKVGHTGTLDPNAAGVLPVCVGYATKVSRFILDSKKKYRTELTLGIKTDTEDIYGTIIKKFSIIPTEEEIRRAVLSFTGTYEQIPPMYSAIKVKGKKLYELAREGIIIKRNPRTVIIYNIDIIEIKGNKIIFDVLCSKGTYVRTLCKDIGDLLGCGGTMSFLLRTESGEFFRKLNNYRRVARNRKVESLLLPLDFPFKHTQNYCKHASVKHALNEINISLFNKQRKNFIGNKVRIYIKKQFIGLGLLNVIILVETILKF